MVVTLWYLDLIWIKYSMIMVGIGLMIGLNTDQSDDKN